MFNRILNDCCFVLIALWKLLCCCEVRNNWVELVELFSLRDNVGLVCFLGNAGGVRELLLEHIESDFTLL